MKVVVPIMIVYILFGCVPYQTNNKRRSTDGVRFYEIDNTLFKQVDFGKHTIKTTGDLPCRIREVRYFRYYSKSDTNVFIMAAYHKKEHKGFYVNSDAKQGMVCSLFYISNSHFYKDDYYLDKTYHCWDSVYAHLDSARVNPYLFGGLSLEEKQMKEWKRRRNFWKIFGIEYQ